MTERIREVSIEIEIDTNQATYTERIVQREGETRAEFAKHFALLLDEQLQKFD